MTDCGEEMMKMAEQMRKQRVPALFREIISNDVFVAGALDAPVINMFDASRAIKRKRELIRAAEEALSWNKDKGTK